MADVDPVQLEVREAVVESLLSSSLPRSTKELEQDAQKAIDRGGGGIAPSRVRTLVKNVLSQLQDEGHLVKNTGGVPTYELTPSGRARLMSF